MIVLNAQQLQRLAESLLRLERLLEAEGGDTGVIREGLDEAAHRMGVHLAVVRLADAGTLLQMHGPASGGDPGKLWATAELLFLDGLRARAEGDPGEAERQLETALALFQEVDSGLTLPELSPSPQRRVEQARRLLGRDS
ncbi:MAG: hypothetical protein EA421_14215 [Gemmatimonadales bacterium]|nr:MAG: hypothetical protein EA421_14215 [Gemmatimonadales bacterium]